MPDIAILRLTEEQLNTPYPLWTEVGLDEVAEHPQVAGTDNVQLYVPDQENVGEFVPYRHPSEGDSDIFLNSGGSMTVTRRSPGRLGAMASGLQNADYIGISDTGADGTAYKLLGNDNVTVMQAVTFTAYGLNNISMHLWLPRYRGWHTVAFPSAPEADRFAESERLTDDLPRRGLTGWTNGLTNAGWTVAQVEAVKATFIESDETTPLTLLEATIANATDRGEARIAGAGIALPLY